MKNIPVLYANGKTLAEAYEKALLRLMREGGEIATQYDKPGDPLSRDATMDITIEEPMTDPMIHKAFPGGIADLREYVYELNGLKDDLVRNHNDKGDTRWEYTYHQRLAKWGTWREQVNKNDLVYTEENDIVYENGTASIEIGDRINQIDYIVEKLSKQPFSRQAQAITWMPMMDLTCYDPPCLQSIWCRIMEEDGIYWLNTNIRFRSNDAWKAFFMNCFGFIHFINDRICKPIAQKTGKEVKMARLNWHADSWHVYGKDIADIKSRLLDRVGTSPIEDRTLNFWDTDIQEMYHEQEAAILQKYEDTKKSFGMKE